MAPWASLMWKSTSFESDSQLRTKRSDGPPRSIAFAARTRARISPFRSGSLFIHAAAMSLEVFAQDAIDAAEAPFRIALRERRDGDVERSGVVLFPDARECREAVARGVVRPVASRLVEQVDREYERAVGREVLEPLAGESAEIGARREEIQ